MARATKFFAGTAFPVDQDRGIRGGHGADEFHNPLHRLALPHQFDRLNLIQALPQPHILLFDLAVLERLADQTRQIIGVERLGDVVVGPVLQRLDGSLNRSVAGHDDDDNFRIDLANLAVQLETVHAGHLDIQQRQIPALARQLQQRLARAGGRLDHVALFLEPFAQRFADHVLIVHH